jgi:hypothetical protein
MTAKRGRHGDLGSLRRGYIAFRLSIEKSLITYCVEIYDFWQRQVMPDVSRNALQTEVENREVGTSLAMGAKSKSVVRAARRAPLDYSVSGYLLSAPVDTLAVICVRRQGMPARAHHHLWLPEIIDYGRNGRSVMLHINVETLWIRV